MWTFVKKICDLEQRWSWGWRLCCQITCSFLNSSVTSVQSANFGATQCSVLPPQLWAFWASSYKKRRWSWTLVARCPSWRWIWLTHPHSGWWHKGRHLWHDTQSSFTVQSTEFSYRQLHLQIWGKVGLFSAPHLLYCPGSAAPQLRARTRESQPAGTQERNSNIWFLVCPVSVPCWRRDSF